MAIQMSYMNDNQAVCVQKNFLHAYRLVKFGLFLKIELHDTVVVIDTVAMEVVHLGCGLRAAIVGVRL